MKNRQELKEFNQFLNDLTPQKAIDTSETSAQKKQRIKKLLGNFEEFCYYYFPNFTSCKFADFHLEFAKQVIENDRIYITRAWARDHAKSVTCIMLLAFLKANKKIKNVLLISKTETMAIELLAPLKKTFEENERYISDFGQQKGFATWTDNKFVTKDKCSFRAIGTGQSPRGTRNDEARPDTILLDDADDDEVVLNKSRLDKVWEWVAGALYGCFSIQGSKRFIVVNNIIADDCIIVRASKQADNHEVINIYDENNNVSWSERFTKEDCEYMIEKMGIFSRREYFNQGSLGGKVFKEEYFQFKQMNPKDYTTIVAYLDPSFSSKKTADHKALCLVGYKNNEYHFLRWWCGIATINEMIGWFYDLDSYLKQHNSTAIYWMEELFLQSLLYKDFAEEAKTRGYTLPLRGDTRQKPNKDMRILSIVGLFERGKVYFNSEHQDRFQKLAIDTFKIYEPTKTNIPKDVPDAAEGAFYKIRDTYNSGAGKLLIGRRGANKFDY
jgi:hypothetical protein